MWLGLEQGARELASLQAAVARRLDRIEFRRELRPFAPHLTLGRIKEGGTRADRERIAGARPEPAGGCTIDHVTPYQPVCRHAGQRRRLRPRRSSVRRCPRRAGAMTQAVPILVGYLFGSIPLALLVSRGLAGVDVRRTGSGNVGSANALRTSGVATALLVMVLDIAKGAGSVLLADRWSAAGSTPAVAGLAAIVGHVPDLATVPRAARVATACGVFAVLTPWAVLPAFALFVATVWATRFVSLGSLVAVLASVRSYMRSLRRRRPGLQLPAPPS